MEGVGKAAVLLSLKRLSSSVRMLYRLRSLMPTYLLVEVHSLLKGFSVVKDFFMILHFEADIARGRDQIRPQAFVPLFNRADLTSSVRLHLVHLPFVSSVMTRGRGVIKVNPVFCVHRAFLPSRPGKRLRGLASIRLSLLQKANGPVDCYDLVCAGSPRSPSRATILGSHHRDILCRKDKRYFCFLASGQDGVLFS
jgi:hypothetical protein